MKAHFDFNPTDDAKMPNKEIGLPIRGGDIVQIISQDDPEWWLVSLNCHK